MSRQQSLIGVACMLACCLLAAFQSVFEHILVAKVDPVLLTLVVCFALLPGCLLITAINNRRMPSKSLIEISRDRPALIDLVCINLATACCWYSAIYGLALMDPATVNMIGAATAPVAMAFICSLFRTKDRIGLHDFLFATLAAALIIWISITASSGTASILIYRPDLALLGGGLAVVYGISMALITLFGKRLSERGLRSDQIVLHRLYGVAIASIVLALPKLGLMDNAILFGGIAISLLFVLPQLLVGQAGVGRTTPLLAEIATASEPAFTLVIQSVVHRIWPSTWLGIAMVASTGLCLVYAVFCLRRDEMQHQAEAREAAEIIPTTN